MKYLLPLLSLLLLSHLLAIVRTVNIDGTADYSSIQSAIDASTYGDTVRVHPGTYQENLNLNGHSITLESLFATTQDSTYISSTRIVGQPTNSAIRIENGEVVTITGFTISNDVNRQIRYRNFSGGGIVVRNNAHVIITDNVVENCTSGNYGGGIHIRGSEAYLSANVIRQCYTYGRGGGLSLYDGATAEFDTINLNSIYNNRAAVGMDVSVEECETMVTVTLDLVSRSMICIDNYFYCNWGSPNVTISTQRSYLPTINHDLYVAPWGSNTNDGLTEDTPLQTIEYAVRVILPDSLDPKTIHMAAGTYSRSANNQLFPFSLQSYTHLLGVGSDSTIWDLEHIEAACGTSWKTDVELSGFTVLNGSYCISLYCIVCTGARFRIADLHFENCSMTSLIVTQMDDVIIENISAHDNDAGFSSSALWITETTNAIVNNVIGTELHGDEYTDINCGCYIDDSDVVINNMAFLNCTGYESDVFRYQNYNSNTGRNSEIARYQNFNDPLIMRPPPSRDGIPDGNLILNNLLVANNDTGPGDWNDPKVTVLNGFTQSIINNCTIANNHGTGQSLLISGNARASNLLLHNPILNTELLVTNELDVPGSVVYLHHSLIEGGMAQVGCENWDNFHYSDILDGDPIFLGTTTDTLSTNQMEYYQLGPGSPCIDAGTPDTTGYNVYPFDLLGNWRVWNNRIDIGCFEYGSEPGVSVDDETEPPPVLARVNAFPNPFNPGFSAGSIISFSLDARPVKPPEVNIYNIRGQRIRNLTVTDNLAGMAAKMGVADTHSDFFRKCGWSVVWDGRNEQGQRVATGVYLMSVRVDGRFIAAGKCMVVK